MRFFFPILISVFIAACTESFKPGDFPVYRYDPGLEKTGLALDYGEWKVTLEEIRAAEPQLLLLEEDLTGARTAAVLTLLKTDMLKVPEVKIYGARREACLLAISRLDPEMDTRKLVFLDGPKAMVEIGPHWVDVYKQTIYDLDTAIQQTQYFFKAHKTAEKLLAKKMPVGAFAKDIYAEPIRSRWPAPVFQMRQVPEKYFSSGHGDASVWTFSAFNCKPCLVWNRDLLSVSQKTAEARYYPRFTDRDTDSRILFESALCLQEQDKNLFWQWLEQWGSPLKDKKLRQKIDAWVKENNLSSTRLSACLQEKKYQTQLDEYQKFSEGLGSRPLPIAVVGNFVFAGPIEKEQILHAVDIERRQRQRENGWRQKLRDLFTST